MEMNKNLLDRLHKVKTINKRDKRTIELTIEFINKIAAYSEHEKKVFAMLGYVPKGDKND